MLVLLPPSEGKTAPRRGAPVDLGALSAPALTPARAAVLDALVRVSARPDATDVLHVSAGLSDEVARNTALRQAPAAPARSVYTGVLHTAAGLAHLTPAQRRRAEQSVRIFSGLWGVVTPQDVIPAYRLSGGVDLPGVGPLGTVWRAHLGAVLDEQAAGGLVVDARSADYVAMWRPAAADWVAVRVERELAGRRSVVSHNAKHARGVLTRHLLTRRAQPPRDAEALAAAAAELVGTDLLAVELAPRPARGARTLTLVVA
ncbi:peroxide stress protein YaaA [Cellulomonas sp. DKR-3]|uniref:Peroxide stress protein YaaA n=1 Tax=Cellulomonas fulva TaxID=2835530 RepID=A0ABS5U0C6_9CELL|nr:peroxide stress protein YaaA [Cellulomonas fulva]MBT0994806.1 peroxide stress protein YaaA [Cellulomonas fulva]